MPITDKAEWEEYVAKNEDEYGKCCVDVARKAMEILDENNDELDVYKVINQADEEIKAGGITGFMAGAVATMISGCHSRGDEFRKAWNRAHNIGEGDSDKIEGVINPAVLTVNVKDDNE